MHYRTFTTLRRWLLSGFFAVALWCTGGQFVYAAELYLSPATGVYTAGQTFTVNVRVDTKGKTISAVEGRLSYEPSQLSVVSARAGNLVDLWVSDPAFDNSSGAVTFTGGMLPPGYTGSAGNIMSVTFRSNGSGDARVSFASGSVNEFSAQGSNVLTNMRGGSYTIAAADVVPEPETIEYVAPANTPAAPSISSASHSDPQGWYQANTAELSWTVPAGVTAVRTLLDGNSGSIPTRLYESPINSITLEELEEGVQYFHLQFQNSDGWGRVAHYRLAVDTAPPSAFTITLPSDANPSNPEQTLLLNAEDDTSPVRRFEVQINDGEPFTHTIEPGASSTITLPSLPPGKHSVIIEAFDAAGNSSIDTFSFTIESFTAPEFSDVPREISAGIVPAFSGTTRANADVTVTLTRLGTEPTVTIVRSDADGVFTYIPDAKLAEGVYELSATAVDEFGAQSASSEPLRLAVQQPGLIRFGGLAVSVLSVVVPLIAMVVLLIFGGLLAWRRVRRYTQAVSKETSEVVSIVEKSFAELDAELTDAADTLAGSRKSKQLTKAEEALVAAVRRAQADRQRAIMKEVTDIENIVE